MIGLASDFIIFALLVPPDGGIAASHRHPDYFGVNHSARNYSALISFFNRSACNRPAFNPDSLGLPELLSLLGGVIEVQVFSEDQSRETPNR